MFHANGKQAGSDSTRLEQWRRIEQITGEAPEPLKNMPTLDKYDSALWEAYSKILQGNEHITLKDILAYSELYDEPFERWEVDALLGIDAARLKEWQMKSQN